MVPHVTLLYGGFLGLLVLALGANVSRVRAKTGTWFDSSPPPRPLFMAIRAHGNAAEWAPMTLVLLLIVELGGGGSTWLHVAGGCLLVGRLIHATALLAGLKIGAVGSTLTWLVLASLGGWSVYLHFVRP